MDSNLVKDKSDFYKHADGSAVKRRLMSKREEPMSVILDALGENGLLHKDVPQQIKDDVAPHLLKIKHGMNLGVK